MHFDVDIAVSVGDSDIACAFTAEAGLTVLFGPSGVGKSSVLNMIAGLRTPDRGHVRVSGTTLFDSGTGVDLPVERRRAGYVFQDSRLFPHMRVAANLHYGNARATMVDAISHLLDIAHLFDRWPRTLSGGEAKRVAIGRALLSDPAFLLLDEPTASLDRARAEEVERAIVNVRDELNLPILMVTHDRAEAERLATRIVEMVR